MKTWQKPVSLALIASLWLAPVAQAADEMCSTGGWEPQFKKEDIAQKCPLNIIGGKECHSAREKLLEWDGKYDKALSDACGKQSENNKKLNELSQSTSFDEVAKAAEQGIADLADLTRMNENLLKQLPSMWNSKSINYAKQVAAAVSKQKTGGPAPTFQKLVGDFEKTTKAAMQKVDTLKKSTISVNESSKPLSEIQDRTLQQGAKSHLETASKAMDFTRKLLADRDSLIKAKTELQATKEKALEAQRQSVADQRRPPGGEEQKSGGFDPMNLLAMAAPLAPLLMQKKNSGDSGITDPSLTGGDEAPPGPPPTVAGTSLTDKKGETVKAPDPAKSEPEENPTGGGGGEIYGGLPSDMGGDISSSDRPQASGGKGAGGGFSAGSPGGFGSPGDSGEKAAGREPASAPALPEEMGALGGGGGGLTFSPPPSSSEEEADGMKEVLTDMEATLDDSPTGLFAEEDSQEGAAEEGIGLEDGMGLFPRVRACYVRNLKKGLVLNGLGEKLPESED